MSPHLQTQWLRLLAFAQGAGVEMVWCSSNIYLITRPEGKVLEGMYEAPASGVMAVQWPKKQLILQKDALLQSHELGCAIHELAHLLACREEPTDSLEPDFMAWEFKVAWLTGSTKIWLRSMNDYGVGGLQIKGETLTTYNDFGGLPNFEKIQLLREMTERGIQYGNIHPSGAIQNVR